MNVQAQNVYLQTKINTSSPGELLLMLYDGCIQFLKKAIKNIESKDYQQKNYFIQNADSILDELIITLNMDYEISEKLLALYVYMKEKLYEANIKLKKESLQEVIDMMTELRGSWAQANQSLKSKGPNHKYG